MRRLLGLGLCVGCGPVITSDAEVTELQISETRVLAYTEDPAFSWEALHTGPLTVEGGCLLVGGFAVVWWERHLADLEGLIDAVEAGEEVSVTIGGGGPPPSPRGEREGCAAAGPLWLAGSEPIEVL